MENKSRSQKELEVLRAYVKWLDDAEEVRRLFQKACMQLPNPLRRVFGLPNIEPPDPLAKL